MKSGRDMNPEKDYAPARIDVSGTLAQLNEILTGSRMSRLNVRLAAALAEEIGQQLEGYMTAVHGLESVQERDVSGKDPAFATERLQYIKAKSRVEAYCSMKLVTQLAILLDALPTTADAEVVAVQLRAIRKLLPAPDTLDSNVTGGAPDDFGDETADDHNPSPDAGRLAAGARPGVDVTLVAALRPVIREMMDRVRQAQLVLRAFDAAASHPPQARDERSEPKRSKPPEPAAGIANDEVRVKEPER